MQFTPPHGHVCPSCNNKFECSDPDDAEFEFALCAKCKSKTDNQQQQKKGRGEKRDDKRSRG